jgi:hypothetical protein
MPGELKEAIEAFINYYNYRRYHERLGDVTPYDVYTGRHPEIIRGRKEAKSWTLQARRDYNRTARRQYNGLSVSINHEGQSVPLLLMSNTLHGLYGGMICYYRYISNPCLLNKFR